MRLRALVPCLLSFVAAAADQAPEPIDLTVAEPPAAKPAGDDAKLTDEASYLIGWQMGQAVKEHGLAREKVLAGLGDAVEGKAMAIPMEQAQQVMMAFQQRAQQKQAEKQQEAAGAGAKRKETNPAWLADNAKKPGVTTTKSGLQYVVKKSGAGAQPTADNQVSVNYSGKLIDGTEFDSSVRNGGPVTFGVGQVIKGWTEALQLMHEGDQWTLYIPSELAYGEQAPPTIGPNQILVFDVELVKVMPAAAAPANP
jgi:FKBP-type peptidyl-prolyl cis-trans isomerase FklB